MATKPLKPKDSSSRLLLQLWNNIKQSLTSKPLKYKELMPRVALEKLKLIEPDDLVSLIGKDLESIRCALIETSYRDEIKIIPKGTTDPIEFEKALLENYAKTWRRTIKFSAGNVRSILLALLKKIEASNIKTMLRAVKAEMSLDDAMQNIIQAGALDKKRCRAIIMGAKNIEDVVNSLHDLESGAVLKKVMQEHGTVGDLLPLEVALDKFVYNGIWDSVEKLRGVDKTIAKNILEIEINAINIKTILRYEPIGISQEQMKDYLIPTPLFNEKILEEALKATDAKAILKILAKVAEKTRKPFYKKLFIKILSERSLSLSRLEIILDTAALEMSLYMMKKYTRYYNISFILAFLNLKWFEIKNVRCIIVGSKRKVPQNQVRDLMVLPGTGKTQ